jgi:ABC-type uncharacterized transport system auxiliary subunit
MNTTQTSLPPWLRNLFAFVLCAIGAITMGCAASRPVKYYVLDPGNPPSATSSEAPARYPVTLLVGRLSSSHLYRDDRLVYGSGPVQLGTYEYQRWAEPPVEMVQDALVTALRATRDYRSVSAIGSNLRGEYILRGRLDSLDEVDKPEIAGRFSIELQLFDPRTGTTVWTSSYSHVEPVKGKTVPDVVEALDRNVRTGVQQLAADLGHYFADHPPQPGPQPASRP